MTKVYILISHCKYYDDQDIVLNVFSSYTSAEAWVTKYCPTLVHSSTAHYLDASYSIEEYTLDAD